MPDMDGYRMTRLIKKNRSLRGMPVVILTSRSSPFDLARGALAGCNSYLVKPVTLQSLRDTVMKHLRRVARREDGGELRFA
jgi:twitching motility two-component system response regulator PilG